jgi:hypothetical protein
MLEKGEWYSAMAVTQRFKEKYTTFIHYTIYNEEQGMNVGINNNMAMNESMVDKNKGRNINNPQLHAQQSKVQLNLNLNEHYMHAHHGQHPKDIPDPKLNHLNSSNF